MKVEANEKEGGAVGVDISDKSTVVNISADVDDGCVSCLDVCRVVYGKK